MTNLNRRNGTEVDGKALVECFDELGFQLDVISDGTRLEIMQRLHQLAAEDHSNADCLVVCILSHGDRGTLWARDRTYPIDDVFQMFTGDKCLSLASKPKMFFIQACQGDKFDRGTTVCSLGRDVADSASFYKIPTW